MSIAAMKHLRVLALTHDRQSLLDDLQRLGCVELVTQNERLAEPEYTDMLNKPATQIAEMQNRTQMLRSALDCISRYSNVKKSLFTPRPEVALSKARDADFIGDVLETAREILRMHQRIQQLNAEEGRIRNQIAALTPWSGLDIPLETTSTQACAVAFGVTPGTANMQEMERLLQKTVPESFLHVTFSDTEQHYLMLLYHKGSEHEALEALKSFGFSHMDFKDVRGTAGEYVNERKARLRELSQERKDSENGISELAVRRADLEMALDVGGLNTAREESASRLLSTGPCDLLDGWVPVRSLKLVEELLTRYDCAYETADPSDDEEPPILLYNSKMIRPFTMVTKMYSMPKYRNIDPNPLISIFYAVFFGMMFADAMYGLILIAIGAFVTVKLKPKGPMVRYMFPLMIICGVSSTIWGVIYGGYFANALAVISGTFFGHEISIPPLWIDPLTDPMTVLVAACIMGGVHVLTGMAIKAYLLIRDGKPWDALMDVGSWWLLFAGIAVFVLNGNYWVAVAGALALICTQGRNNKSIVAKIGGGFASLYDITAYLSDILSYSRLMALGLAGGVLGMVFNTMGALMGRSVLGVLFFIAIFAFGHVFNMGMSIIGCYVHAARLMYVEYFGKFYEGGGVEFNPLAMETKYVNIIEEE